MSGPPYNVYGSGPYYPYNSDQPMLPIPQLGPQTEEKRLNSMHVNESDQLLSENRYYPLMQPNQAGNVPLMPIHNIHSMPRLNNEIPNQVYYSNVYHGYMNYQQPYLGPYSNRKYDIDSKPNQLPGLPGLMALPPVGQPPIDFGAKLLKKRPQQVIGENYKPKKPKKNSKPRINKLSTSGTLVAKPRIDRFAEESMDNCYIHFQMTLGVPEPRVNLSLPPFIPVKTDLERKLFDLFIHQVSGCMDMFISRSCFGEIVPQMALLDDTGMILSSIFSLSALMLQRVNPNLIDDSIPMNYYHQTIRSIRSHLSSSNSNDEDGITARCLLSTVLLCVYEMFFLATDNTYVKGSVSLLTSIINKSTESSPLSESPFLEMCFWATFTCDLILSLKFNLPTMFSVKSFWKQIDPTFIQSYDKPSHSMHQDLFLSRKESVWWLHKALLDFSIINEFNHTPTVLTQEETESNSTFAEWTHLNVMMEEYGASMPLAMKPLIYKPSGAGSPYPTIYFRDELSALVNLQYKLSQVALYQGLIQRTDVNSVETQTVLNKLPSNFVKVLAKDIIGILKTYDLNLTLWPINIHTIRIVARYLHDDEEEYGELESLMERVIDTCHFIFQSKVIIG